MILAELTEEKVVQKMVAAPEVLKYILDDPDIKVGVDAIGNAAGLTSDSLPVLEALVSLSFIGLLRPEAMSGELIEMFGVDAALATQISQKLQENIFAPYKPELDALYSAAPAPMPAPLPIIPAVPTPVTATVPAATASVGPTLNLKREDSSLHSAPLGMTGGAATTLDSGFRRNDNVTATPKAPAPPVAPFILKKADVAEQVVVSSGFKLNLDPKIFSGGPVNPAPPPAAPRPAKVEMGNQGAMDSRLRGNDRPQGFTTAPSAPRVVHYSEPTTGTSSPFAPRTTPPAPPSPPTPPTPLSP